MKIIVMGDSHGNQEIVKSISALPADALFHCGDSELSYTDPVFGQMQKVRGNCDLGPGYSDSILTTVNEKSVFVVHGHQHDVKESNAGLYHSAKENRADIVLFGHSHLYSADVKDGILYVNPGSVLLPRGGTEPTYAVIEWAETVQVTFRNLMHEVVETIELDI